MGNKLCCDTRLSGQLPLQLREKTKEQLIKNFMDDHPAIHQLCSNPGQIYATVSDNVKGYEEGIYIGKVFENQRHQLGLMMFKDGMYYQGEWAKGLFQGRGKFFFTNGDFYEGQWKSGLPDGEGLYVSRNPVWRYEGHWQRGLQSGKGKEIFEDGSFYEGDFYQGLRHGKGRFRNHDGRYYKGSFIEGEVEGFAQVCNFDFVYEGQWKKGKPHGTGKSQWQNEKKKVAQYIGEYQDGKKQGFGEYKQTDILNGLTFKGVWNDGHITNVGIIIQSQKKPQSDAKL